MTTIRSKRKRTKEIPAPEEKIEGVPEKPEEQKLLDYNYKPNPVPGDTPTPPNTKGAPNAQLPQLPDDEGIIFEYEYYSEDWIIQGRMTLSEIYVQLPLDVQVQLERYLDELTLPMEPTDTDVFQTAEKLALYLKLDLEKQGLQTPELQELLKQLPRAILNELYS